MHLHILHSRNCCQKIYILETNKFTSFDKNATFLARYRLTEGAMLPAFLIKKPAKHGNSLILNTRDLRINTTIHWQQIAVILETFYWSRIRSFSKNDAETQTCLTFSRSLSLPNVFLKYPDD